jgi:hypothetical protein
MMQKEEKIATNISPAVFGEEIRGFVMWAYMREILLRRPSFIET